MWHSNSIVCDPSAGTGTSPSSSSSSSWSRIEEKLFEEALVIFPEETRDRWAKIAGQVPGKSVFEVGQHYEDLVHDLMEIESGRVELPAYVELDDHYYELNMVGWGLEEDDKDQVSFGLIRRKDKNAVRRKGVPWTRDEHRLFLIGLERYGKGDWRSISRNVVVSRTPTQVASHAQKYFLRLNSIYKYNKRSSIHDITTAQAQVGQTPDQILTRNL